MNKCVAIHELFDTVPHYLRNAFDSCQYPWELLSYIPEIIKRIAKSDEFWEYAPGIYVNGEVKISDSATLIAPLVICEGTEIRPSAYLRGNVIIGRGSVIGNSTEIKNSILLDGVQVPHYNYVGDSVLGNRSHMGAGAVCSNLKSGGGSVTVHSAEDIPTGLRKLGAILGDGADIGCGCVLNPGTVVGKGTRVYPLTALRGVYPASCIVKSANEIVAQR